MSAPRRRWWRRLGLAAAAVLLAALLLATWLLQTGSGRDAVLARLQAALPADALSWQRAEGTLAGPLQLHGLRYRQQDGLVLEIDRLALDPALWPSLGGRLQLAVLEAGEVRLHLPPAKDEAFEPPRWPEVLPRIPLPFGLQVETLSVQRFGIDRQADATPDTGAAAPAGQSDAETPDAASFEARDLQGRRIALHGDGLSMTSLQATLAPGRLTLAGHYLPAEHFRTELHGRLVAPAQGESPGLDLHLLATGNLDALALELAGQTPEPLEVRLELRNGADTPVWTLQARSDGLPPAWLGADADATPWRGHVQAGGRGGEAQLQGELASGELQLRLLPSQLALVDDRLLLQPLRLGLVQGELDMTGQVQFGQDAPVFDLRLAGEALRLAPAEGGAEVLASGELRLQGQPAAWTLDGEADLLREGERAQWQLTGEGNREALQLHQLDVSMPGGGGTGSGRLAWAPQPAFALDLRLQDLDPGYVLPDLPGALSGRLQASAARNAAGQWRAEGRLDRLRGRLRGLPVAGQAQLAWQDDHGRLDAELHLGGSHVLAAGTVGRRYDLRLEARPLALADALPPGGGRIEGWLRLLGPADALDLEADLVGHALRWGDDRIGALRLHGRLPASGSDELVLAAEGLHLAGLDIDALVLRALGHRGHAGLQGNLAWTQGQLQLGGELGLAGDQWRGRLASLHLQASDSPDLRLQAPAAFRFGPGLAELEPACLLAAGVDGRLCAEAGSGRARLQAEALPLSLLQPWLPQDDALPLHLSGQVAGAAELRRGRDGRWQGEGRLHSDAGALRLDAASEREVFGYRALALDWRLDGGRLEAELDTGLAADGRITARLATGTDPAAALDGELDLDVRELTWLELFSEDLAAPAGRLHGRLQLAGTRAAPVLSGQAQLSGFQAELPALGLKLREGDFSLDGQADGSTRLNGAITSGDGRLQVAGELNLRDAQAPLLLALRGKAVTLANTPEFHAIADPDLLLHFAGGVLGVRGRVDVPRAGFALEALETDVAASDDVVVLDPLDPPRQRRLPLDIDLTVTLGEEVRLQGFGLDGKVGGRLHLRQRPGGPARASGSLDVSGRYRAYGQALAIERARLGFADSPVDNPSLDIRAGRDFEQVSVRVRVTGTARRPSLRIESDPAMDTSEALSWLVFGRPLRSASSGEAEQLSAAAMALGAGGNLVAQQIGTRLGLDEAGIAESRNLGGAALTVGKYLSPRLFISYGVALVGTGQVVTLKYLLSRGFDISIESGNESAASINWRLER
ncbi:MAG TPA: translocation/assembly module TamB domain-containing protein [Arenimonas sp.]|nr:translocation/assembly module TamB domain-containing protein [Arenimonas sp.]